MLKQNKGPWIQLYSGKKFYFFTSGKEDINIFDISRGLSNCCRWANQAKEFYSVAQHSVLLSIVVPKPWKFYALMHDAHEALLGDMPRPLKSLSTLGIEYTRIADRIQRLIEDKYNVTCPDDLSGFKNFDRRICIDECAALMRNDYRGQDGNMFEGESLGINIKPWTPENSYHAFNKRFAALYGNPEGIRMEDQANSGSSESGEGSRGF